GAAGARGPPHAGFQLSTSATTAGAHLAWTGGAGPVFQVRRAVGANGRFSSLATVAGAAFDDTDLILGLTYAYQVVDLESLNVTNTRTITATLTPPTVITSGGGTAASTTGGAAVSFAAGAFSGAAAVSVLENMAARPAGLVTASKVYSLSAIDTATGDSISSFAIQPTLTLHYDPAGLTPSSIFYIAPDGSVSAVPSVIDPVNHTISAQLSHFSDYTSGNVVTVSVSPASASLDAPDDDLLTATVNFKAPDPQAPDPAKGAMVTFSITSGPGGFSGNVNTCVTDINGQCSVTLHSDHAGNPSATTDISAAVLDADSKSDAGTTSVTWTAHTFDKTAQDITIDADNVAGTVTINGIGRYFDTVTSITLLGDGGTARTLTVGAGASFIPGGIAVSYDRNGGSTATLTATRNGDQTLTDTTLLRGRTFSLTGVTAAVMNSGGSSSHTIDASGWSHAATLNASTGGDTLIAGTFGNTLNGGSGDDILVGGTGDDTFNGSDGKDTYRFAANFGHDTLQGADPG
ncbi:MAG TPA: hypothetical protein VF892_23650, partial [Pseudonocardiaceae bacterium]